jgi:hypothetical protein
MEWFEHFVSFTKPSASDPVLPIVDGHSDNTRNLNLIFKARECHVAIICLPPNSTHAPAITQNIHGNTEALLRRRNKVLAVAQ